MGSVSAAISKLERLKNSIGTDTIPMYAVTQTHAAYIKRIFTDHERRDGASLGEYSEKYIIYEDRHNLPKNRGNATKFKSLTKKMEAMFPKSANEDAYAHWGRFYEDTDTVFLMPGFQALRKVQGFAVGERDLQYSGSMFSNIANSVRKIREHTYGVGFTDPKEFEKAKKMVENINKSKDIGDRFKYEELFGLSTDEKAVLKTATISKLKYILKNVGYKTTI